MNEEKLWDWLRLIREESKNVQQQLNFITALLAIICGLLFALVWRIW